MKEYSNVSWSFLAEDAPQEAVSAEPEMEPVRWDLFGQYDEELVAA